MTSNQYTKIGIIHGWKGNLSNHWQNEFAKKCRKAGLKTIYPTFPNKHRPKLEEWLDVMEKKMQTIDKKTVLVGHSLGCHAILHVLEKKSVKRVGLIILVSPSSTEKIMKNKVQFLAPFFQNVDVKTVRSKAKKIEIFASDNDKWIDVAEAKKLARALKAKLHIVPNGKHLSTPEDFHVFPKIMEKIETRKRKKSRSKKAKI